MAYQDRIQTLINLEIIQEEADLEPQASKVVRDLSDAEFEVMLLARERLNPQERKVYDKAIITVAF